MTDDSLLFIEGRPVDVTDSGAADASDTVFVEGAPVALSDGAQEVVFDEGTPLKVAPTFTATVGGTTETLPIIIAGRDTGADTVAGFYDYRQGTGSPAYSANGDILDYARLDYATVTVFREADGDLYLVAVYDDGSSATGGEINTSITGLSGSFAVTDDPTSQDERDTYDLSGTTNIWDDNRTDGWACGPIDPADTITIDITATDVPDARAIGADKATVGAPMDTSITVEFP